MSSKRHALRISLRLQSLWNCGKVWAIFVLLCFLTQQAVAERVTRRENAIKAAFLFHLTQFVNWPEEAKPPPGEPIHIAVLAPNPFENILEEIVKNERIDGNPIEVIHITEVAAAREAEILFIPEKARNAQQEAVALSGTQPLLLVGETREFLALGGMIALVREEERVAIVINRDALEQAGLSASSRLLRLARTEKGESGR